jgi:hypothetical protein
MARRLRRVGVGSGSELLEVDAIDVGKLLRTYCELVRPFPTIAPNEDGVGEILQHAHRGFPIAVRRRRPA